MKIAFVTPIQGREGGVEIFNRDLYNILKKRGHQIDFFTLDCLKDSKKIFSGYEKPEKPLGDHFNKVNEKEKYDVVLCNGEFGYSVKHDKAINVFHGNYYDYANAIKDFAPRETIEQMSKQSEKHKESAKDKYVVSVSDSAKEGLVNSGVNVDRVINLSVDTSFFYPQKKRNFRDYGLFVGKGIKEKGFDVLEKIAEQGVDLRILSDKRINMKNVKNYPPRENESLRKEYSKAKVIINPTLYEGGGLVTLEAMACGSPVITTPTGYGKGIQEEIPEFVANFGDPGKFVEKYNKISEDPKEYSKKSWNYFNKYHNRENFKNNWINLIENI